MSKWKPILIEPRIKIPLGMADIVYDSAIRTIRIPVSDSVRKGVRISIECSVFWYYTQWQWRSIYGY